VFVCQATTAEKAILSVQSLLLTPTIHSRLDPKDHAKEYTVEEVRLTLELTSHLTLL
jgi:hypothetical protein